MRVLPILGAVLAVAAPSAQAATQTVTTTGLTATIETDPWSLTFTDGNGRTLLQETETSSSTPGRLGFSRGGTWYHATRATDVEESGGSLTATLETNDPLGNKLELTVAPAGDRHITVTAVNTQAVTATGIGFATPADEGFYGFGERSNAVNQRGKAVTNRVEDGPWPEQDSVYVAAANPPYGHGDRPDSTYYPLPWLLSSRGYGFLINGDPTSRFHLADQDPAAWSADIDGGRMTFELYGGPKPIDSLRMFSQDTGRQPVARAPWVFGPWFQTGQPNTIPLDEEATIIKKLRDADAPASAAETQMHFLPCGAQRGLDDYLAKRTQQFHDAGLAHLGYFNPSVCESYKPVFDDAAAAGILQRNAAGRPSSYPSFVGGSGPFGFTEEPIAQFDFSNPGTEPFYANLVKDAYGRGYDGWMEDFGEYTAPDAQSHDGTPADAMHNRYPTDYHCTVRRIANGLDRPVTRHQRSGWIGSARCADIVWGGDPTTIWGFDGLSSTITQGVGIGMSGVARWGSDIGGYNSFGANYPQPGVEEEKLTPEMLKRWIQLGAVSPVMRTKRTGIAVPSYQRPQVFDDDIIGTWRRHTKLHTQLYPYLLAADQQYRQTGMPIMRHALLTDPDDAQARAQDGQFMFGDALLAAPVVTSGQTTKDVYAPRGVWLDFDKSVRFVEPAGAFVPLGNGKVLIGRRTYKLDAPLERLPLLIKAGSVLPMLPPDVDTLADYGTGVVHLKDRRGAMTLLSFPRGTSTSRFNTSGVVKSVERRRRWRLSIRSDRARTFAVRATMWSLRKPFRPRAVRVGKRRLRFAYRDGVLTFRVKARRGTVTVTG